MTKDNPELQEIFACYVDKLNAIHGLAAELPQSDRFDFQTLKTDGVCRLGEFEIIRELGRGGMGTVYEARQRALDRSVALKLLPMTATFDSRQVARFKNEANAAGQLHHPNIVPIYSVGSTNQIHYYAMQLIQGVSIDQWIAERSRQDNCDWQQPVRWAVEIASALQCAHESGVIHRDVKPSNLMLDQSNRIWITDFGLARVQKDLSLTESGDMIGTLRYMSPEQASGKPEVVDHRTDVYSLAVTLFEMLTQRPALQGDTSAALLKQLDHDQPVRLKDVRSDLPAELSVVLQKAMAKRKDERYESADLFAADLCAVLDGRPTMARPPSPMVVIQRYAVRHRQMMTVATTLLFAFSVLSVFASGIIWKQNQDIREHQLRADQNSRRARSTVDQLGSKMAAQLASIPGTERVRRQLLEDTLIYYRQFISEAADDRQLQTEIAATHSKIGRLVAQLESSQAAIPHFRTAEKLFDQLPPAISDQYDVRRLIAENLNHLGTSLTAIGKVRESVGVYEQAIAIRSEDLKTRQLQPDELQLAKVRNNLGLSYQTLGNGSKAREMFAATIEQLQDESDDDPSGEKSRILAAAMTNLSMTLLETQPGESIRLLETAISKRLNAINDSDNRLLVSEEIATMYCNLGSAQAKLKRANQAVGSLQSAIRLQRKLSGIAPNVQRYCRDLAMSLNNLGMLHQRQGDTDAAVTALAEAVRLQQLLINSTPTGADLSRLGAMEHNFAVALIAADDHNRATELFDKAIKRQQRALAILPRSSDARAYLRQHYLALHRSQVRHGEWTKLKATEAALRETANGDSDSLRSIEREIRLARTKATPPNRRSVAMVKP